jgi:hypothetical protein
MLHLLASVLASALIMLVAVASATAGQEPSPDPTFLDTIRVVEVEPAEGELTFRDREGEIRTVHEGDVLEEVESARVEKVSRTTLVLTRVVRGGDGQEGEALIVVRFDSAGKTKVREYRTVPDVSPRTPRQPNHP